MVVAEQYPELRATENFQQLQAQLSETEDQIQITRRVYNDTVQTYNTSIQIFPAVLVASAFHFERREFFDAPKDAEATPEVSFRGRRGRGHAGRGAEVLKGGMRRGLIVLPAALAVAVALPAAAAAQSANVTNADVGLRLAPDASLLVKERLTFDYRGELPRLLSRHPAERSRGNRCEQHQRPRGESHLSAGWLHLLRLHRPDGQVRRHRHARRQRGPDRLASQRERRAAHLPRLLSRRRPRPCAGLRRRDRRLLEGLGRPVGLRPRPPDGGPEGSGARSGRQRPVPGVGSPARRRGRDRPRAGRGDPPGFGRPGPPVRGDARHDTARAEGGT